MQATEGKTKPIKTILAVFLYLFAVLLVFLGFSLLCREDAVPVEPGDEPGVIDLRHIDFANQTAKVALDWQSAEIYPGAFYTAADFAGGVTQERSPGPPLGDYGTLRLVLRLPPGEGYAIAAKNISFSQRMFIDGREIGSVGEPAETMAGMTAANRRYMEGFSAQGDTTELILHYAGFIHANGGGLYPVLIGSVRNVAQIEQRSILFEGVLAAALLTAMLFFFGLFLFFGTRRYLLWFSLLCACLALLFLGINNNALLVLLPDVPFPIFLRLAYMGTCWAGLFALAPTTLFTRYPMQFAFSYVEFLAYLLLAVVAAARRGKLHAVLTRAEGLLLGAGMELYIVFAAINAYAHQHAMKFFGWEYQMVGIMVFVFLNLLALTLIFSRTERERDSALAAEREMQETNAMMERLGRLRADVIANITHELKAPLSVMDGYAQLAVEQLDEGETDETTRENLLVVSGEAKRLARLADGLVRTSAAGVSWQREWQELSAVFQRAANLCRLMVARGGNQLSLGPCAGLPPVLVNGDMIHQVLLNLAANAGRGTRRGTVSFSAKQAENGFVAVTVADNGSGIDPDLLPRVFRRGISGEDSTGMGLAICKEIIEAHGGEIDIDSAPGYGTRVTFTIPTEQGGETG